MSVAGITRVVCPGCGTAQDCKLIQSINTRKDGGVKQRLLAGELNMLACDCGRRSQLAVTVVFHDPDADLLFQVCPGDGDDMAKAAALFTAVGASGTRRLVPTLNALVEKVKIADAGLEDWAIEMAKVLLLASLEHPDLDRVLLFDSCDRAAGAIHWLLFDRDGRAAQRVTSQLAAYEKLAARSQGRPAPTELEIDRAWAVHAVQTMIADAN